MILVNLGCGEVYHPAWLNLDAAPCSPHVRRCDVYGPLPFPDGSVDVVYHSHLLEHLTGEAAHSFLAECRRILRPGGIIRVVVPDLEGIARAYLGALAAKVEEIDDVLTDWCRLELTDQATRSKSGGAMQTFLAKLSSPQQAVVRTRAGAEVDSIMRAVNRERRLPSLAKLWLRLRQEGVNILAVMVGGRKMKAAVQEGWFRNSGEVHRVMYDRDSLSRLLKESGFIDVKAIVATESRISGFNGFGLDAVDGCVRKPDSLFMEAVRR